jgi:hypothetical protein
MNHYFRNQPRMFIFSVPWTERVRRFLRRHSFGILP